MDRHAVVMIATFAAILGSGLAEGVDAAGCALVATVGSLATLAVVSI